MRLASCPASSARSAQCYLCSFLEVLRRVSGESPARLPTCPRRWAERAAAGEGPTARLFGAPTWVGGVNQDSGKWQRRGPKHRQATDWCPAPPGEIRTSFGVQALPGAGTVATCIGPPQPNASAVNGLSTAENLPWRLARSCNYPGGQMGTGGGIWRKNSFALYGTRRNLLGSLAACWKPKSFRAAKSVASRSQRLGR